MPSSIYNAARERMLGAGNLAKTDLRVILVRAGYHFDPSHTSLTDLGEFANGESSRLVGVTITDGVLNAAGVRISARNAYPCDALVIHENGQLTAYIGVPAFTPFMNQICEVIWDSGADKIFRLAA